MRKIIVYLCTVVVFGFYFTEAVQADELSELKAQMKAMQRQMEVMQEKIEKLEAERQAWIETPKEMEERVIALEEKLEKPYERGVSADPVSKEKKDTGFVGGIVIRQQKRILGSVVVIEPVRVDLRILDTICRENIKSIDDYAQWLQKTVKYKGDGDADVWSSPEETLTKKYGDCEDIAFLNKTFLHVLGYQPKVMALLRNRGKNGHAICVFKKSGYYLWFNNTKLNRTSATSMEEFAKYILTNHLYARLFEINPGDRNQNILGVNTIE